MYEDTSKRQLKEAHAAKCVFKTIPTMAVSAHFYLLPSLFSLSKTVLSSYRVDKTYDHAFIGHDDEVIILEGVSEDTKHHIDEALLDVRYKKNFHLVQLFFFES